MAGARWLPANDMLVGRFHAAIQTSSRLRIGRRRWAPARRDAHGFHHTQRFTAEAANTCRMLAAFAFRTARVLAVRPAHSARLRRGALIYRQRLFPVNASSCTEAAFNRAPSDGAHKSRPAAAMKILTYATIMFLVTAELIFLS